MRLRTTVSVVLLAMLGIAAAGYGQTQSDAERLVAFKQTKLYASDMTYAKLEEYLNLAHKEQIPIGEKVAAFASQYIGHTYNRKEVCHSDKLNEGNMTIIAGRSVSMANARNFGDYYVVSMGLHFYYPVPADEYRILWYPVQWNEYCQWAFENVTENIATGSVLKPDRIRVWNTYHSWKNRMNQPGIDRDKREKFTLARPRRAVVDTIQTGNVVFFMSKLGPGDFKDLDVGVAVREADNSLNFVRTEYQGLQATIVKAGLPQKLEGQLGDGLIIYRPKALSPQLLDNMVQKARSVFPIPKISDADNVKLGRVTPWFNLPEAK